MTARSVGPVGPGGAIVTVAILTGTTGLLAARLLTETHSWRGHDHA